MKTRAFCFGKRKKLNDGRVAESNYQPEQLHRSLFVVAVHLTLLLLLGLVAPCGDTGNRADSTIVADTQGPWKGYLAWAFPSADGEQLYFIDLTHRNIGRYDLTTHRIAAVRHSTSIAFSPIMTASFDAERGIVGNAGAPPGHPNVSDPIRVVYLDSQSLRTKKCYACPRNGRLVCWFDSLGFLSLSAPHGTKDLSHQPLLVYRCGKESAVLVQELKIPEGKYYAESVRPITERGLMIVCVAIQLDVFNKKHLLLLYDLEQDRVLRRATLGRIACRSVHKSPSSDVILLRKDYDNFEIRGARSLEPLVTVPIKSPENNICAVSDHGRFVAYAHDRLYVWDRESGSTRMLWHVTGNVRWAERHRRPLPISKKILDWIPRVYALGWLMTFLDEAYRIVCLRFLPDHRLLAVTGDGLIRIWDTRTWKQVYSDRLVLHLEFIEQAGRRIQPRKNDGP